MTKRIRVPEKEIKRASHSFVNTKDNQNTIHINETPVKTKKKKHIQQAINSQTITQTSIKNIR